MTAASTIRYVVGAGVPAASALALSLVLARALTATEYGIYFGAQAVIILISTAAGQWLAQSAIYHLARSDQHDHALEGTVLTGAVVSSVVAMLGVAAAGAVGLYSSLESKFSPVMVLATGVSAAAATMSLVVLAIRQSEPGMPRYNRLQVRLNIHRMLLASAVAFAFSSAAAVLMIGAIVQVVALLLETSAMRLSRREESLAFLLRTWVARHWKYGAPFVVWAAMSALVSVSDRLIIGALLGAEDLGRYSAAYTVSAGIAFASGAPALLYAHPKVQRLWASGREKDARILLVQIVGWLGFVAVLTVTGAIVWGRDLMATVFGERFASAGGVLPLLVVGSLAWQCALLVQKPLEASGRLGVIAWALASAAVVNIGLNVLFVDVFGIVAAAVSTTCAYLLYLLVVYRAGWSRAARRGQES